jgi:hypothetical protein
MRTNVSWVLNWMDVISLYKNLTVGNNCRLAVSQSHIACRNLSGETLFRAFGMPIKEAENVVGRVRRGPIVAVGVPASAVK